MYSETRLCEQEMMIVVGSTVAFDGQCWFSVALDGRALDHPDRVLQNCE